MKPRQGRTRAAVSLGVLLSAAALVTAALSVLVADVVAELRAGTNHEFNIQVAAQETPSDAFPAAGGGAARWTPAASEWREGNPSPVEIGAVDRDRRDRTYAIAVRNASPELPSTLCLSLDAAQNPEEFARLDLALVDESGERVTGRGAEHPRLCTDEVVAPGGVSAFALRVSGGDPEAPPTIVRLRVDGEQR